MVGMRTQVCIHNVGNQLQNAPLRLNSERYGGNTEISTTLGCEDRQNILENRAETSKKYFTRGRIMFWILICTSSGWYHLSLQSQISRKWKLLQKGPTH